MLALANLIEIHIMKKICLNSLVHLFLLITSAAIAQQHISPMGRMLLREPGITDVLAKNGMLENELAERYALLYKNNAYHVRASLWINPVKFNSSSLSTLGVHYNKITKDIYTLTIPLAVLAEVAAIDGVKYLDVNEHSEPDLSRAIVNTRAREVHQGGGQLLQAYRGEGVIIAIIDWGYDYTHPVFYDTSLTYLRISRAWDQNKLSGPHPAGYDFGAEYIGMDALLQAQQDTLYVFGPSSHGTHVGGIAGGSGGGTRSVGHAPDAELIFISLRRDAPSFLDAIKYISDYADSVGKPFVVNMSFGNHIGPHDGTSLENKGIDEMAGRGKIFVGSAGNNGDNNFHLMAQLDTPQDTVKTVVNFANLNDQFGQLLSMWGSPNSDFSVKMVMADINNQIIFESNMYHSKGSRFATDTLTFGSSDTLIVRLEATEKSPLNDRPNIRMEVRRLSNLKMVLYITSASGSEVHVWNVVRLNPRATNWGVALSNNFPGAVAGNIEFGVGVPAGVGREVITVASHLLDLTNAQDSIISFGPISTFSSRGPTLDKRNKPDISGPGQGINSAVNSFDPNYNNAISTVIFNGKKYPFAALSGTSMSGPAVAGIVALMLQVNQFLTAQEIKEILQNTARLDEQTGQIGPGGSLTWGRGKVDALAAVLAAQAFTNVKEVKFNPDIVKIYPNPATHYIKVEGMDWITCNIYQYSGQLMLTTANTNNEINLDQLAEGNYLVELSNGDFFVYKRLQKGK
jgi:minor extracellular serine protease Vpr